MSEGGSIARQRRLEPGDLVHVQADDFDLWRDDAVIRGKAPEELSHDDIGCFTAGRRSAYWQRRGRLSERMRSAATHRGCS
jgi:hypothetical protein